jgi:protein-S-isoprenylcysteine O-methyltransferase Ste14
MRSLVTRSAIGNTKFLALVALALFASAGTLRFWQAWLYLGLYAAWLTLGGVYLLRTDPALLARRLLQDEEGEKERVQRILVAILRFLGLATLVVAGIDRRLGASALPPSLVLVGGALFVAGAALVLIVFRANTFTSSIIEVAPGQQVVAIGPYRVVRHPMYAGTLLMGIGTPLLLGSCWALLFLPAGWGLLALRILAEERFLASELAGYRAYMDETRARLIPGVW